MEKITMQEFKVKVDEELKKQLLEDNDLTPEGDSDIIAFKGCDGGC